MSRPKPVFASGLATFGQASHPHLWRGLVGLWVPSVGWQGQRLVNLAHRSYPGTINNSPPWVTTQRGPSLDLNGTSQFVDCGDIHSIEGVARLTVMMWARPQVLTGRQFAFTFSKGDPSGNSRLMMATGPSAGRGGVDSVEMGVCNGGNTFGYTAGGVLVENQWRHLCFVFDGTGATNADRLKFYVNGLQVGLTYFGTQPTSTPSNVHPVRIGWDGNAPSGSIVRYWDGEIDDVRVYIRTLSAGEVFESFAGASPLDLRRRVWAGASSLVATRHRVMLLG